MPHPMVRVSVPPTNRRGEFPMEPGLFQVALVERISSTGQRLVVSPTLGQPNRPPPPPTGHRPVRDRSSPVPRLGPTFSRERSFTRWTPRSARTTS